MGITDEFRDRMDSQPDKYTLAWWQKQFGEVLKGYRGATHRINVCLAEYEDQHEAIQELRKRCDELEKERDEDRATIGELLERVERMAAYLNSQRNGKPDSACTDSAEKVVSD